MARPGAWNPIRSCYFLELRSAKCSQDPCTRQLLVLGRLANMVEAMTVRGFTRDPQPPPRPNDLSSLISVRLGRDERYARQRALSYSCLTSEAPQIIRRALHLEGVKQSWRKHINDRRKNTRLVDRLHIHGLGLIVHKSTNEPLVKNRDHLDQELRLPHRARLCSPTCSCLRRPHAALAKGFASGIERHRPFDGQDTLV